MRKLKPKFFLLASLIVFGSFSPNNDRIVATLTVSSGQIDRFESIVTFSIEGTGLPSDQQYALFEKVDGKELPIDIQFSTENESIIHWQLSGKTAAKTDRSFYLKRAQQASNSVCALEVKAQKGSYHFLLNNKKVFTYQADVVDPPSGVDSLYKRGGFIHPLYAPNEAILTAIQPADHYHHYGIWNPWTKTNFLGEEIDFWNLAKGQGTIINNGVSDINKGNILASIKAKHKHITWPETEKSKEAITELQEMILYNRTDGKFLIQLNSTMIPQESIILQEYRYGGFGYRATEYWTNENSKVFTSEGLDRKEADGQPARWCVVVGDTPQGKAGILFMGHPDNFNFPEPLRVWPVDANNNRGDVFINFSPTRNKDWQLEKGKNYMLKYRMLIFEGDLSATEAENIWNDFAHPVQVTFSLK